MEFTIRTLVVVVMIVIAFVVLVALITNWTGDLGTTFKSLTDWFGQLLQGGVKLPFGQTQTPTSSGTGSEPKNIIPNPIS